MKRGNYMFITVLVMAVAFTAAGCSSSGGDGGGAAPASVVSIGAMTKGSVILNGVTFEDNAARITGDDTVKFSADLQNGMTVKVRGRVNDDRINGTAERIEIENEVRGAIEAKVGDTITVHGQMVLVDGGTIFANGTPTNDFAGLVQGDNVEVHGVRDAAGVIRATRVEELGAGAVDDEVRGFVSGLSGNLVLGGSFTIGTLSISTNATTSVTPTGSPIVNGTLVEVHLNGAVATRIHVEDADDEFEPAEGEEFEVEGFVAGCPAGSSCGSDFTVGNQPVRTSSSTRFEGGVKNDLVNDMKVEAEGRLLGGILVANKIAFKDTVRIVSNATTTGSADLLGKTVLVTSKTDFSSNLTGTVANIIAGRGLEIRGFVNKNSDGSDANSITATRVVMQSGSSNRDILRGPVKNISGRTFTIVGIPVSLATNAVARPDDDTSNDDNSLTMPLDSFFSSLVDGRTIVKARGTFSAGTLTADEIELE